jgi:proton glutamate symport protein
MLRNKILAISFVTLSIASIISFLNIQGFIQVSETVTSVAWWIFIATLLVYSVRKKSLTTWILVAMVIGIRVGLDFHDAAMELQVLSKVFLKLIKTIIAPILFATLVVGIAGHSNMKQLGRIGWKSILYFEIVTTLALVIGLVAINISKAGVGIERNEVAQVDIPKSAVKQRQAEIIQVLDSAGVALPENLLQSLPEKKHTWQDHILDIFPENIAKSIYDGQVLQIVVFSILFGIGLAVLPEEKKKPMLAFCESLSEVMFKFTNIIMYFAPFGVGAAIAHATADLGMDILFALFRLLLTLYVALIAFVVLVLGPIMYFFKIPVRTFFKAIKEPVSIAFATTSSESALPKAMENMEKIGVPRKIVSFVLPTGYTFNLDGTTLYLSLAAIFVAQATNMDLSIGEQFLIGLTLMLTSKGVAGIPRASLVILIGTAATFNMEIWPIMAILGIDELMDMARTSVNVTGNCLASCVIARWEGELDDEKLHAEFIED